jgi:hypothetical protein
MIFTINGQLPSYSLFRPKFKNKNSSLSDKQDDPIKKN